MRRHAPRGSDRIRIAGGRTHLLQPRPRHFDDSPAEQRAGRTSHQSPAGRRVQLHSGQGDYPVQYRGYATGPSRTRADSRPHHLSRTLVSGAPRGPYGAAAAARYRFGVATGGRDPIPGDKRAALSRRPAGQGGTALVRQGVLQPVTETVPAAASIRPPRLKMASFAFAVDAPHRPRASASSAEVGAFARALWSSARNQPRSLAASRGVV